LRLQNPRNNKWLPGRPWLRSAANVRGRRWKALPGKWGESMSKDHLEEEFAGTKAQEPAYKKAQSVGRI